MYDYALKASGSNGGKAARILNHILGARARVAQLSGRLFGPHSLHLPGL
jgi:hypothetical protein